MLGIPAGLIEKITLGTGYGDFVANLPVIVNPGADEAVFRFLNGYIIFAVAGQERRGADGI
mgnify:CR=1 FL=1